MSWRTDPADIAAAYAAGSEQDPHYVDDGWEYDPTFVKTYRDDDEARSWWGLPSHAEEQQQRGEAA